VEWQAGLYDRHYGFVSEYGKGLLPLLAPKPGERILDLGCGTGDLTAEIHRSGAEVIGVDRSEAMIREARRKFPSIEFVCADAVTFESGRSFHAVFSNAVLHWIRDAEALLRNVYRLLLPGGRFVAEFGGAGNVRTIEDAIRRVMARRGRVAESPWFFPTIGEYAVLMEKAGFCVVFAAHFERMTELEDGENGLDHWIRMFAFPYLAELSEAEIRSLIEDVKAQVRDHLFYDGKWHADYRRIRVAAVRED